MNKSDEERDAYREGYKAYQDGVRFDGNPYHRHEEKLLYTAWFNGYSDAEDKAYQ